jgi:hypothetical protein
MAVDPGLDLFELFFGQGFGVGEGEAQPVWGDQRASLAGMAAQQRWSEINGEQNTWYCGAYWQNGFHEDGVVSALRVANSLSSQSRAAA